MNNITNEELKQIEANAQAIFIQLVQEYQESDDILISKAWVIAVTDFYKRRTIGPIANA
jgi:hypothetical protein